MMKIVFVLSALLAVGYAREGFGPGEQDWAYVEVRPRAYMFWWLYETTAKVSDVTQKPLVIWLQGGPGASSTSYGNFAELGPQDIDLNERNNSWVKEVNVLYIDNPVGTGYGYVQNLNDLSTTGKQIADDLIACIFAFYKQQPRFRNVPLYVAAESYGGKMALQLAVEANKLSGDEKINLQGLYLIDSWISPIDSVLTWAPFLYHVGAVDRRGMLEIEKGANDTKRALDRGEFKKATDLWRSTERIIMTVAKNIDFYNILTKVKGSRSIKSFYTPDGLDGTYIDEAKLTALMTGPVKRALKLNSTHSAQRRSVFTALEVEFMKPATDLVEKLLNETTIKVVVVTGQLDLIVDTPGTIKWVENLRFKDVDKWRNSPRNALVVNNINEGYQQKYGRFSLYWVNRAGHMVPLDNVPASLAILDDITGVKPT